MTTTEPDPLDDIFNQWYDQFGCRFYSKEGHKEYLKYAFTNGLIHGLNAATRLQDQLPPKKRKTGRSLYRYPWTANHNNTQSTSKRLDCNNLPPTHKWTTINLPPLKTCTLRSSPISGSCWITWNQKGLSESLASWEAFIPRNKQNEIQTYVS